MPKQIQENENARSGCPSAWIAVFAFAGVAAAAWLVAKRLKRSAEAGAEDLFTRCDRAAKALDHRIHLQEVA